MFPWNANCLLSGERTVLRAVLFLIIGVSQRQGWATPGTQAKPRKRAHGKAAAEDSEPTNGPLIFYRTFEDVNTFFFPSPIFSRENRLSEEVKTFFCALPIFLGKTGHLRT